MRTKGHRDATAHGFNFIYEYIKYWGSPRTPCPSWPRGPWRSEVRVSLASGALWGVARASRVQGRGARPGSRRQLPRSPRKVPRGPRVV